MPPDAWMIPRNTSVALGHNATFNCQFNGIPRPLTRWYFSQNSEGPGLLVGNSSRFVQNNERLHVSNVSEKDQGWFICVGKNIAGMQNFTAYLNVLGKFYTDTGSYRWLIL